MLGAQSNANRNDRVARHVNLVQEPSRNPENVFYDKDSLLACSLTRRSWYITAVPHLHYTITTLNFSFWMTKRLWPRSLLYVCRLGLLPLVKKLQIYQGPSADPYGLFFCGVATSTYKAGVSTPAFYLDSLALTNIRGLEVEDPDFPGFTPRVQ